MVVVIDNNSGGEAQAHVAQVARRAPFEVRYLHEPVQGIATARNRVLELAIAAGADWIALIDDDEVAEPGWLGGLLVAATRYDADVVEGETRREYPNPLPRFIIEYQPRSLPEGTPLEFAATNNVLFKSWIVRPEGAGLRFDETFNLTGAEDLDFFLRAKMEGASIVRTNRAKAFESMPAGRLTLRSHLSRLSAEAATNAFIARQRRHPSLSVPECLGRLISRLTIGLFFVATAPIFAIGGGRSFEAALIRGTRRIAWAVGALRGLVGWLPKPYRQVEGS